MYKRLSLDSYTFFYYSLIRIISLKTNIDYSVQSILAFIKSIQASLAKLEQIS